MAGPDSPTLEQLVRPSRLSTPDGMLVLLHGRGADEHDLHPLLELLDPDARLIGLTPRAPLALPPGGAHWYVVERVGFPHRDSFHVGLDALVDWLERTTAAHDVPPERVVLGGFSQGAVMSLSAAIGERWQRPAGVIAMSGFIPQVEGWAPVAGRAAALAVHLSHGRYDEVIPANFGRAAAEQLRGLGADVTWRETDMPHAISPALVAELRAWLDGVLPGRDPATVVGS